MFVELRELLCSGAIRRHQLGSKGLLTLVSLYHSGKKNGYCYKKLFGCGKKTCIIRRYGVNW